MSSIWSKTGSQAAVSPFDPGSAGPRPGGLRAAGRQAGSGELAQAGFSPRGKAADHAASPMTTSTTTGAGSGNGSADAAGGLITANDFLSLLVTEMQNQDPTADTDPNEYISQLVQINSLEQLISINQNLVEVLGTATNPVTPPSTTSSRHTGRNAGQNLAPGEVSDPVSSSASGTARAGRSGAGGASNAKGTNGAGWKSGKLGTAFDGMGAGGGNLSVPRASPASREVAHALDGRARGAGHGHGIRDIPTHP